MTSPKIDAGNLSNLGDKIKGWAEDMDYPRTIEELAKQCNVDIKNPKNYQLKPVVVAPGEYPLLIPSKELIEACEIYLGALNAGNEAEYPVGKYYKDDRLFEHPQDSNRLLNQREMSKIERTDFQLHRIGEYCLNICM